MANLVNLERVSKAYGVRPLLADVSLGVAEGQRITVALPPESLRVFVSGAA
jgi:ATP-binding cassette subfamily F protein uup